MNENSCLCRFLAEHPEDWERLLHKEHGVRVRREGPLAVFNYGFDCVYAEPLVQEARGIIIDTERLEVVCWPFRKFGNHTESYADPIDWPTARVQEKVDGSIIKLWYDRSRPGWQFATNGTIRAEDAPVGEAVRTTFADLIRQADNYADIPFDDLDRDSTYIFELVTPRTQVIVRYSTTTLYHLGTRSNLTGEESETDIGIRKPREYPIHSLAECVETAMTLNAGAEDEIRAEGFVVVDGRWNRVKVKSPDYIARHQLMELRTLPKKECLRLLLKAPEEVAPLCDASPVLLPAFRFYEYHLARLASLDDRLAELARMLYGEYSHDRGAVAKVIGRHPLSWIAFRCIGNDHKAGELLMAEPLDKLARLIPEYQQEDLHWLFEEPEGGA